MNTNFLKQPTRSYLLLALVAGSLVLYLANGEFPYLTAIASALGALPTLIGAFNSLKKLKINIDTFNTFALVVSFVSREIGSAAFIVLMLLSAELLDFHTESRSSKAMEELLKLKPEKALKETGDLVTEIPTKDIKAGDTVLVKSGSRVPVDGTVIFGEALVNESSVTGESMPVGKIMGDAVLSSSIIESGAIKIIATKVGEDSTINRMAALVKEALKNKSKTEKLADSFAGIFLPVVVVIGIATYLLTKNITMTAAIFLVACADDMAVAIPLAVTAALGQAAKRGVIVKGGQSLETLGKINTLVMDKTGTLTYGNFSIKDSYIEPGIEADKFWRTVAIVEKFSDHPISRAVFRELSKKYRRLPDPDKFEVLNGSGISAKYGSDKILIGSEKIALESNIVLPDNFIAKFNESKEKFMGTTVMVVVNRKLWGFFTVGDAVREEAKDSLRMVNRLGVKDMKIFTGDNKDAAAKIAGQLGIDDFRYSMKPEDKLREIETITKSGGKIIAVIGDGINDAPVLARADVGVAMGKGGTAVAVESADIVILTDNLARLPEMIVLGRKTSSVIRGDIAIWVLSNILGFTLVLTGFAGPAIAAFYNFVTDFLPIGNSLRLFKK